MVGRPDGKLSQRWGRRAPRALPRGRHVSCCKCRQVNRAEFEALASVNGHDVYRIHVGSFGGYGAVRAVLVERFDAADAIDETLSAEVAEGELFVAHLQQVVDRHQLLLRDDVAGADQRAEVVASFKEPGGEQRPRRRMVEASEFLPKLGQPGASGDADPVDLRRARFSAAKTPRVAPSTSE